MSRGISFRKRSFAGHWLLLGLAACCVLFLIGGEAWDHPTTGLASVAVMGAFLALCVGSILAALTVLWGGFAVLRWLWTGGRW